MRGDDSEGVVGEPGIQGEKGEKGLRGDPAELPLGNEFKDLQGDAGMMVIALHRAYYQTRRRTTSSRCP